MKHIHNYTLLRCNSNYPFEDSNDSPVRRRAEIKDDSEREREREARGSNEEAERGENKEGKTKKKVARENLSKKTMC